MKIERDKEYMIGDEIYRVICVDAPGELPVIAVCVLDGTLRRFMRDGRFTGVGEVSHALKPLTPYADFKDGDPVITDAGVRRHFAKVDADGRPLCYVDGWTAWTSAGSTSAWDSVRRPTPEELK